MLDVHGWANPFRNPQRYAACWAQNPNVYVSFGASKKQNHLADVQRHAAIVRGVRTARVRR